MSETDIERPLASDDVALMVVSCDKYSDLWDPFFHCLKKYWPDCPYPVYLVTNNKTYEADGVRVVKIGDDRSYSDNLRSAIDQINEQWVILWLEDVLISKAVDTRRITSIIKDAQSVPVGYLKISPDLPLSYENDGLREIGPIPKGVRYRSAVGLSLYRIETLKKLLVPNASAWDLDTSTLSDGFDEPFYALTRKAARHPPIRWAHGVIKGRWYWPAIRFLKREGFGETLKGRRPLGISAFLYIRIFKFHNFILRSMNKHWY